MVPHREWGLIPKADGGGGGAKIHVGTKLRFELGAALCPTHVGGHLSQLWDSNKSYLSISSRVQDTFLK